MLLAAAGLNAKGASDQCDLRSMSIDWNWAAAKCWWDRRWQLGDGGLA